MAVSLTDNTVNPIDVVVGGTVDPFAGIDITNEGIGFREDLTIRLSRTYFTGGTQPGFGTISDPTGGGAYDATTGIFTESALVTGTPNPMTDLLHRLVYTPPTLPDGASSGVAASIIVNSTSGTYVIDPKAILINTVTPPVITGTLANEPVSSGSTIRPFATANITDANNDYGPKLTFAVTVTDDKGNASDADGLLTGNGLSKTGVGTYVEAANYSYGYTLQSLTFAPSAVAAGATRTTHFELKVTDTSTPTPLVADDKTTSVIVSGPAVAPVAPLIAGTAHGQKVVAGNAISPLHGVTISDTNATPSDSATLTVTGGGTLSGTGIKAGATAGTYSVDATTPDKLTLILDEATFTPPALGDQASLTSVIRLDVVDNGLTATDNITSVDVIAPPPPPPVITPPPPPTPPPGIDGNPPPTPTPIPPTVTHPDPTPIGGANFSVTDETTGKQMFSAGEKYTGPVAGLDSQFVLITPDKLNITASIPNVFLHSGAGDDALDVSTANGNNILDGSTGSNFLTGGSGMDTFYLDDRNPLSDVFSTVKGLHSGDNITVFGINDKDFKIDMLDNIGAVGAKGLDYAVTAAGHANANLVLSGYTMADAGNGKLTTTFGTTPDLPGLPGSQYMNIHVN